MRSTRRTQPYRKGTRAPGPVLDAMLRGRSALMPNPMDVRRRTMLNARRRRRAKRLGRNLS